MPAIKRQIHVVKERARSTWNNFPFARMSHVMIVEVLRQVVMWLNAFPVNSGVSDKLPPCNILTCTNLDYTKSCKLELGAYAEYHEAPRPSNDMKPRAMPGICLSPVGNLQGS